MHYNTRLNWIIKIYLINYCLICWVEPSARHDLLNCKCWISALARSGKAFAEEEPHFTFQRSSRFSLHVLTTSLLRNQTSSWSEATYLIWLINYSQQPNAKILRKLVLLEIHGEAESWQPLTTLTAAPADIFNSYNEKNTVTRISIIWKVTFSFFSACWLFIHVSGEGILLA